MWRRLLDERDLPRLLVVTTNYDDLLERALVEEGLEFDLVWYEAKQNVGRARPVHSSSTWRERQR